VLETIRRDPGLQTLPVILFDRLRRSRRCRTRSELHADQYIAKPVSPNVFADRVKRLLSHTFAQRRAVDSRFCQAPALEERLSGGGLWIATRTREDWSRLMRHFLTFGRGAPRAVIPEISEPATGPATILIIDDHADSLHAMSAAS